MVVHRHKLRATLAELCRVLTKTAKPPEPDLGSAGAAARRARNLDRAGLSGRVRA